MNVVLLFDTASVLKYPGRTVQGDKTGVLIFRVLSKILSSVSGTIVSVILLYTITMRPHMASIGRAPRHHLWIPGQCSSGARSFAATTTLPLRDHSTRPVFSAKAGTCFQQKRWITQNFLKRLEEGRQEWASHAKEIKAGNRKSFVEHLESRGLIHDVVG